MTIVEVEQHNLPRARGRLVRLSYPMYQVHNFFYIPLYVSLANHEPSIMYLSNYLLQGITWGHRSRGSIGDFLKTTILVLALLKGKVEGT